MPAFITDEQVGRKTFASSMASSQLIAVFATNPLCEESLPSSPKSDAGHRQCGDGRDNRDRSCKCDFDFLADVQSDPVLRASYHARPAEAKQDGSAASVLREGAFVSAEPKGQPQKASRLEGLPLPPRVSIFAAIPP